MSIKQTLYPIREVSSLTGINPITLRAWERRYDLIEPVRTEGGHRLYTQAHIDHIKSAIELTEKGIPISQVKALLETSNTHFNDPEQEFDDKTIKQAVSRFDVASLNKTLDILFADTPEADLNLQLRTLSLFFISQQDVHQQQFWLANLLPRLYMHLRLYIRKMDLKNCQRILIQNHEADESLLVLTSLLFAERGVYPIIHAKVETKRDTIQSTLEKMKCDALALVDTSDKAGRLQTEGWHLSAPKYNTFMFLTQPKPDFLNIKSTCYYQALDATWHNIL